MKSVPTGKTRFWTFVFFLANICGAWWFVDLTYAEWFEGFKWIFGIYSMSEVGSKGANAYMNKAQK